MPSLLGAMTYPKPSASCNSGLVYHVVGPTVRESSEWTQRSWARSSLCMWNLLYFELLITTFWWMCFIGPNLKRNLRWKEHVCISFSLHTPISKAKQIQIPIDANWLPPERPHLFASWHNLVCSGSWRRQILPCTIELVIHSMLFIHSMCIYQLTAHNFDLECSPLLLPHDCAWISHSKVIPHPKSNSLQRIFTKFSYLDVNDKRWRSNELHAQSFRCVTDLFLFPWCWWSRLVPNWCRDSGPMMESGTPASWRWHGPGRVQQQLTGTQQRWWWLVRRRFFSVGYQMQLGEWQRKHG
jgi:hypothetical protein